MTTSSKFSPSTQPGEKRADPKLGVPMAGILSQSNAEAFYIELLEDPALRCWNQIGGGCEYRADVVAARLEMQRVITFKAWLVPEIDSQGLERYPLRVRS